MIIANRTYSVSEITELIRMLLETEFTGVRLEGEISNCRPASSGHLYFTLKDHDAMIQAVMFRNRCASLSFRPIDGKKVVVEGNISVYGKRGTYQVVCESMKDDGTGDILLILEERKRRLAAEGLFDQARKRPLPMMPSRVAVVTSPTGAAIRDILNVLRRRNSGLNLVVLPAAVQGDGAAEAIARQIETANLHRLGDVLIVGRGGGSLEDLLPFSEERVVRAVAASRIPVISAVGHEVDVALSDLAADLRAPTPSAAAELVSGSRDDLLRRVRDLESGIRRTLEQRIDRIDDPAASLFPGEPGAEHPADRPAVPAAVRRCPRRPSFGNPGPGAGGPACSAPAVQNHGSQFTLFHPRPGLRGGLRRGRQDHHPTGTDGGRRTDRSPVLPRFARRTRRGDGRA